MLPAFRDRWRHHWSGSSLLDSAKLIRTGVPDIVFIYKFCLCQDNK